MALLQIEPSLLRQKMALPKNVLFNVAHAAGITVANMTNGGSTFRVQVPLTTLQG
jgi:hypothetical protein